MQFYSTTLRNFLYNKISKKKFGVIYCIVAPLFFCSGAALEFAMIHWTPNGTNFCK